MANAVEKLFDSVLPKLAPNAVEDIDERVPQDGVANQQDCSEEHPQDGLIPVGNSPSGAGDDFFLPDSEISSEDRELIEGGLRGRGMEVLAFYKSRRYIAYGPFKGYWGIFYLNKGLEFVRQEIDLAYPGYLSNSSQLALEFLREHERFHFRADLQTLMFEATLGKHLHMPLRSVLSTRPYDFVEEALANRQAWDWSKKGVIGIREFAYDFMKIQPGAYARFDESRMRLAAEWASAVVDLRPFSGLSRRDLAPWVEATPRDFTRASLCPEYIIRTSNLGHWISPVYKTPEVKVIEEGKEVEHALNGRFVQLRSAWDETKKKLVANRHLKGLDFKPWKPDGKGAYSVRVDKSFRAHLRHLSDGKWTAYGIGNHKEMGHG